MKDFKKRAFWRSKGSPKRFFFKIDEMSGYSRCYKRVYIWGTIYKFLQNRFFTFLKKNKKLSKP